MMNDELAEHVRNLGISKDQILREEAEMDILDALSRDIIGTKVIFYGGTALRLAYGSPRFSEDIDLLRIKNVSMPVFRRFVERLLSAHQTWRCTDIKEKQRTLFALIVITDEKLKHNFSIKIELHKPKKAVNLKTTLTLLKSPVSISEPLLIVPTLQSLKTLKEEAIKSRTKARDIFDLWYISTTMRQEFVIPRALGTGSLRTFRNELRVFLPRRYDPIIEQLYASITQKN